MIWAMSGRRSDPYYRNNAVAAAHLQMAGFTGARAESWGGGTEGIVVPHPDSPHHNIEIGQHPDYRNAGWQFRVTRDPEDPGYQQEGIPLGRTQMKRLVSPGPEKKQDRDDEYNSTVHAHPRQLPEKLKDFVEHPQVRNAVKADVERIKTERKMPGPLSGDQFRPRQGD